MPGRPGIATSTDHRLPTPVVVGAALALFAAFVALGSNLKLTITGPLLHF